jgi:hypothetical protein
MYPFTTPLLWNWIYPPFACVELKVPVIALAVEDVSELLNSPTVPTTDEGVVAPSVPLNAPVTVPLNEPVPVTARPEVVASRILEPPA